MKSTDRRVPRRVNAALFAVTAALGIPMAAAQSAPTLQAQFVPNAINLRAPGGLVTIVLSATSGDLSACTLSNVHIGTAAPVLLSPSSDRRTYVAAFSKSDLTALLPGFESIDGIVTGALQCGGVSSTMVAHATARVLKQTTVQAKVKPVLNVGGSSFKDSNGN